MIRKLCEWLQINTKQYSKGLFLSFINFFVISLIYKRLLKSKGQIFYYKGQNLKYGSGYSFLTKKKIMLKLDYLLFLGNVKKKYTAL